MDFFFVDLIFWNNIFVLESLYKRDRRSHTNPKIISERVKPPTPTKPIIQRNKKDCRNTNKPRSRDQKQELENKNAPHVTFFKYKNKS